MTDCQELLFSIQPNVVEIGGTITLNCSLQTPRIENDILNIASPALDESQFCSADCYTSQCYDIDSCQCDAVDPNTNKLCPAGTKSVSYTVSNVRANMWGNWVCEHYNGSPSITHHMEVYGK